MWAEAEFPVFLMVSLKCRCVRVLGMRFERILNRCVLSLVSRLSSVKILPAVVIPVGAHADLIAEFMVRAARATPVQSFAGSFWARAFFWPER